MSILRENYHLKDIVDFFHRAVHELTGYDTSVRLLDFGCGAGQLVEDFLQYGYDAYGSDVWATYDRKPTNQRLSEIQLSPYRLPFEDDYFDIVVSTSVLEHAKNTEECFMEIYRVLKLGGYAMHMFPGKWYLPSEPHMHVPLVNWFWPKCPKWWMKLWAVLGVRNEFQKGKTWKEVYRLNEQFHRQGICYYNAKYYENLSMSIFKNFSWPMTFYIDHAPGKLSNILRKLPFKSVLGALTKEFRMGFLLMKKEKL